MSLEDWRRAFDAHGAFVTLEVQDPHVDTPLVLNVVPAMDGGVGVRLSLENAGVLFDLLAEGIGVVVAARAALALTGGDTPTGQAG